MLWPIITCTSGDCVISDVCEVSSTICALRRVDRVICFVCVANVVLPSRFGEWEPDLSGVLFAWLDL